MTKEIILNLNKVSLVDDEDYEYLIQWRWYYNKGYAERHVNGVHQKTIRMHRIILDAPKNKEVDHINGDKLDNRKENLRLCDHSENSRNNKIRIDNTSGYKGVAFYKRIKKWRSQIRYNNQKIWLGYFNNPIDAAQAYDKAAIKYHGRFASINFPKSQEEP